jgi:endonuclease I
MLLAWNTQDPVNAREIARNIFMLLKIIETLILTIRNMFNKSGTRQLIRKHLQYQPI